MFSMTLNRAKQVLFERKCEHNILPQIERHVILLLVNQAWGCIFRNVEENLKASAKTGWNPLYRAILDDPEVARTMTEKDKSEECGFKYGKAITSLRCVQGNKTNMIDVPAEECNPTGKVISAPHSHPTP